HERHRLLDPLVRRIAALAALALATPADLAAVLGDPGLDNLVLVGGAERAPHQRSSPVIWSIRRWWRPPENGVVRNRLSGASATPGPITRAPSAITLAALWARASS